jgi:hypothetical protein
VSASDIIIGSQQEMDALEEKAALVEENDLVVEGTNEN